MSQTAAIADPRHTSTRERPPAGVTGPLVWIKTNLFGSWWSTAVTLVLGYLILRYAAEFISWAVLHAIWSVPYDAQGRPDNTVCQNAKGIGACWAVIADKYRLILFGRYPYDEQWRPAICRGAVHRALCRLGHAALLAQGTGADLDRDPGRQSAC